jgi:hypothetical protein
MEPLYMLLTPDEHEKYKTDEKYQEQKNAQAQAMANLHMRPVQVCVMERKLVSHVEPTIEE